MLWPTFDGGFRMQKYLNRMFVCPVLVISRVRVIIYYLCHAHVSRIFSPLSLYPGVYFSL